MKEYEITKDMIKEAVAMSKDMGTLNGSLLEGQGNTWGFLGEIIAAKALAAEHKNTYDYDLITPLGHTVDVKFSFGCQPSCCRILLASIA